MNATTGDWLDACLTRLRDAKVTVFGDFCIDAYWTIDEDLTERSVETGKAVHRVREQRYALGGAGTIVNNLTALGVGQVRAVGLVGEDLFGRTMLDLFAAQRVDAAGMLHAQADWQTSVYAKPYIGDDEQHRLDFGTFNELSMASVNALADALDKAAARSDVVICNQQFVRGVTTPVMIERINALAARRRDTVFMVDARDRAALFRQVVYKMNGYEAARLAGRAGEPDQPIDPDVVREVGGRLFQQTGRTVFITRGPEGIVVVDAQGVTELPGVKVTGPVDPVGAGDSVLAALAAVLGSGGDAITAARLANLAASVTVRKLRTTGTASPEEIRAAAHHS